MAADFNPYHVWLGIPPEEQPANHYRLLGIKPFETSGDVIDNAADRQMAHLRTIQVGKRGDLSQRLLNEVAAARVCLLDPKKRAAYDSQLRAKLPAATAAAPAVSAALPVASLPVAAALPQPSDQTNQWDDLLGNPDVKKSATGAAGKSAKSAAAKSASAKRGANNRNLTIGIAVAVAVVAVVGIGIFLLSGSSTDGTLAFDWPANDRTDTTLSVDGVAQAIPASGPWEYRYPTGSHRIVAEHLAYKLDTHVDVVAGERQTVPADWKAKATLVLNWPLALRSGAELRIDGRVQTISQHEPLEVAVEPGRRQILITRRGFDPIRTAATVVADGRELVAIAAPPTTAKLVFDWPPEDRKNAELIVDGRSQTIAAESGSAPFELTLPPGRHVVHITRTGFEPFNQAIDLSAGTDSAIKPTWTPEKKSTPTVAETQVPVEVAPQPAKKLPIPAAAEQEKIAKQLNDLYKTSQPGAKDPAKAQELYDVAAKDGSSPAERYMLLMKGAEIAAAAGDLNLSLQGIDTLDADYEIDTLDLKQKLLEKFIAAGKPDQVAIAIPTAEQLVDQAVAADRFDIAVVLATTASKAVAKSKIATHKEVEDRLARRRHDIHLIEPIYAAAKKAQETLEKTPADPDANLTVGRWLCFYKGDWNTGLPMLAKGSDEKLKALAEQEIKAPADADQQVQIADAWWDLAQKEAGIARDSLHLHAGNIYQEAMPNLASALKKAAIEKRLAEIANLGPATSAGNVSTSAQEPTGATRFPLNKWVNILRLVDPTRDTVKGKWSRDEKEISCEREDLSRLVIPVSVDGSYEMEVNFTRTAGDSDVNAFIVVGSRQCLVMTSCDHGGYSGIEMLDGHGAGDNPTSVRPGVLETGRRYQLLVKVQLSQPDHASIDVALDGRRYLPHWEGNPESLHLHGNWSLPNSRELALGTGNSRVTFHSVRLRLISGHAAADASVTESAVPQVAPATVVSDKPSGPAKFPLNKWVDVLRLVDTTRNVVKGKWSRVGHEITTEPEHGSRIVIPVAAEGSYDLEVVLVRHIGETDIATTIPVGSHACDIIVGWNRDVGLDRVNGERVHSEKNPTKIVADQFENGQVYRLLAKVRMLDAGRASVDAELNGKPIVRWKGDAAVLSVDGDWAMPTTDHFGLGAWDARVTFKSARLRMISGSASADSSVSELAPTQGNPTITVKSTGAGKLPLGKGTDLLAKVDTNRDSIEGHWERQGSAIFCNDSASGGDRRFLAFPTEISDASYELRVEFSRDSGNDSFAVSFPVGDKGGEFILCDVRGKYSGLETIDGRKLDDEGNPTARSPSTLENGRRHVVRIAVNVQGETAKINCFLDGDELVAWKGKVDSLDQQHAWKTAPHRIGVGEWASPSTIYSATLRVVK